VFILKKLSTLEIPSLNLPEELLIGVRINFKRAKVKVV